jgi:hypothetical protein
MTNPSAPYQMEERHGMFNGSRTRFFSTCVDGPRTVLNMLKWYLKTGKSKEKLTPNQETHYVSVTMAVKNENATLLQSNKQMPLADKPHFLIDMSSQATSDNIKNARMNEENYSWKSWPILKSFCAYRQQTNRGFQKNVC